MTWFNHFLTGTNQWDPLPDMNEIRSDFSAVTYGSSAFAIGGFNGTDVLGGVEQYNFEEGIWRRYTSLVTPRSSAVPHSYAVPRSYTVRRSYAVRR